MNHPPNHLSVLAREQSGAGVYHIPTMAGARVENGKHVSPSAPHAHGMMNFSAAQSVGPPHFHPADVWDGAPPPTSLQARSATTDSSGDWRAAALHPVLTTGSDPEFSTLAPGSSALLHRVPQVVASSAAGTTATPFFASTAVATAREVVVVGDHLPGSRSALPEPAAIPTWTTPSTSGVASASARFGAGALPPAPQPAAVAGRHFLPTRPITTHSVHRSPPAPIAPAMPAPPMAVLDLGISRAGDAFSAAPSARAATAHTNGRGSPAGLSFEDFAPHPAPPEPPSAWNYSPPSYVLPQTHPTDTPDLPGTTVGQGVGPVVASVIGSAHQMPRVSHVTLAPPAPPSLPARGPADSNSYWEAGFGTHVAAPAGDVAPSQLWDTARHGAQPKGLPEAPAELVLSRAPPQSSSGVQRKPNLIVNYLGAMTSAELQALCERYGKVMRCRVVFDPRTRQSRGYAFVRMATIEEADSVIRNLQGFKFYSCGVEKTLKVGYARPRTKSRTNTNCFFANLSPWVTGEDLRDVAQNYGSVLDYKLLQDARGVSRRCGFVRFAFRSETEAVLKHLHGKFVILEETDGSRRVFSPKIRTTLSQHSKRESGRGRHHGRS